MTLFLKASSFYSIFTQLPKSFHSTGRFLQVSWRRCHSSSGFSLSQFALFLHVIPDRLDDDEIRSMCGALAVVRLLYIQKSHWIITIYSKRTVYICKLIYIYIYIYIYIFFLLYLFIFYLFYFVFYFSFFSFFFFCEQARLYNKHVEICSMCPRKSLELSADVGSLVYDQVFQVGA